MSSCPDSTEDVPPVLPRIPGHSSTSRATRSTVESISNRGPELYGVIHRTTWTFYEDKEVEG